MAASKTFGQGALPDFTVSEQGGGARRMSNVDMGEQLATTAASVIGQGLAGLVQCS
jgi:hypothetical protein